MMDNCMPNPHIHDVKENFYQKATTSLYTEGCHFDDSKATA